MKKTKKCSECGGSKIRTTKVAAGGGYAPDLLPGSHPWWREAELEIYVCCTCGHFQYFVPTSALESVIESDSFHDWAQADAPDFLAGRDRVIAWSHRGGSLSR